MSLSALLVVLSSLLVAAIAQPDFLKYFCLDGDGNYTSNSAYQTNLDLLLPSLPSNASVDGFNSSSVGRSPDRASAIALCRGDVLPDACWSCVNDAVFKLPRLCPFQKGAVGWYDNCMLKFSNQSMVAGTVETTPFFYMRSPHGSISSFVNMTQFNQKRGELMDRLRMQAAAGSVLKYATGQTNVSSFWSIYGLVQCTPDLSELSCRSCLEGATREIPVCCNGLDGGRVVKPSCNLRYEANQFYDPAGNGATPAAATISTPPTSNLSRPPFTNSSINTTGSGNNTTRTVITVVVSTISVVLAVLICFVLRRKPWKKTDFESEGVDVITTVESLHFDFSTVRVATDNFSQANKLGQGGFGMVYKGMLSNGTKIAVKRLSTDSGQGDLEFKNEVLLVAKLQHRNLVRLLGFSLQGKERLLIYEFVPCLSLDKFLFNMGRRSELDWERRYKIIGGIARGLLYLHEDSRLRIIHRDLKASNILLDADMSPKISDFGMARLFAMDQTQGNTSRIVGTYGYMAPEYAMQGQFSVKSDIFSFGVLVLEIVSGQRNHCFRDGEDSVDLITYAWKNWREGTALSLVDPTLSSGSRSEITRCIHIGLLCVQDSVADRPTMASVLLMLDSNSVPLPVPSKPPFLANSSAERHSLPFLDNSGTTDSTQSKSKSDKFSVNEETITESDLYPR